MASSREVLDIKKRLKDGSRHDLVILAIPSHDRDNKPLNNQLVWADAGLETFSELYGGATAFQTFKGIFRSESGEDLWDEPILIEAYAERAKVENTHTLAVLLEFIRRMKRATHQESILLVINDWRRFL